MREDGAERESVAGFVLAGGESRRMGRDKALVDFAGEPLIARALKILRQAGLEARIAGARAKLEHFAPVIEDAEPGRGPLAGVCAALTASAESRAVFLPADLPLLPSSLIKHLVHRAATTGAIVTLVSVNGFTQSFPAVLDRAALPILEDALRHGRGGCFAAFEQATEKLLTLKGHGFSHAARLEEFGPALESAEKLVGLKAHDFSRAVNNPKIIEPLGPEGKFSSNSRDILVYSAASEAAARLGQHIASVPVEYLAQAGQVTHPDGLPPSMWFLNVNSPADRARAEAIVGAFA